MSNLHLGFSLLGGALVLVLVLWSTRLRDLEQQGNLKAALLGSILFTLFFVSWVPLN